MKRVTSPAVLVLFLVVAVACSTSTGGTPQPDALDEAGPTDSSDATPDATPDAALDAAPDAADVEPGDPGPDDAAPDGNADVSADEVAPAPSKVRALLLSPDAPAVDVELAENTSPTWSGLEYLHGTPFVEVTGEELDFHVMPVGGDDYSAFLHEHAIAIAPGEALTLVAYGPHLAMQPLVLREDPSPVEEGHVRVRFAHTAKAEGRFDVWALPPLGERHGDELLAEGLAYGDAGDWLELHAEPMRLGLDFDHDGEADSVFDLGTPVAGAIFTLFAVSDGAGLILARQDLEGALARLDPVVSNVPDASARVIHLSPDAPVVDVLANDDLQPLFTQVAYLNGTPYAALPAGTYDLHLAPVGGSAPDAVCTCSGAALGSARSYTTVAFGDLATMTAVVIEDSTDGLAEGSYRAQVFHAAVGVGKVDVWSLDEMAGMPGMPGMPDPKLLANQVPYGALEPLDLAAGAHELGLDLNGDGTPEATFLLPAVEAAGHVNLFVVAEGAGPFLVLQLADGGVTRLDPI